MQKHLMGFALYLFSLPLYALDDFGFYFGGSAIATYWDVGSDNDLTLTLLELPTGPTSTNTGSVNFDDNDWDLSVEGRLGSYLIWGDDEKFFTALDLFISPYTTTFTHEVVGIPFESNGQTALNIAQEIELHYTYGLELKQGYFFTPHWLGFLLLGGVESFYRMTTNLYVNDSFSDAVLSDVDVIHTPGVRFGGGVERFWDNGLSLTLQATYTAYEEIDTFLEEDVVFPVPSPDAPEFVAAATDDNTFDPSAFQISLGLNFYF